MSISPSNNIPFTPGGVRGRIGPRSSPGTPSPESENSTETGSQYSSDFNSQWDNYMNEPSNSNSVTRRNRNISNSPENDDFIQGRSLLMSDLDDEESKEEEDEPQLPTKPWANREMYPIPSFPKQIIDINAEGFDPFLMDNQKISDYIQEDKKENVVILYNNKYFLTTRAIIEQQEEDALVYECLEGDKKRYENIVGNLPLYNLKKIGINISNDNAVGIEPEYIYMDGIDELLTSSDDWPYYAIIPLPDKMLVSVISKNEALKIGTGQGSGVSALHCQAGQGGLTGILVKAYPSNQVFGGKKNKKTLKKRRKQNPKRKTLKKPKKKSMKTIKKRSRTNTNVRKPKKSLKKH